MRARILKPSFFSNEDLVQLPFECRLLFIGLWTLADCAGRLEDRPLRIKMQIFPADEIDVHVALDALMQRGLIRRYAVGATAVIDIPKFTNHQHVHPKERERGSELPEIPTDWEKPDKTGKIQTRQDQYFSGPAEIKTEADIKTEAGPSLTSSCATRVARDVDFVAFWNAYPKHKSKQAAVKAWLKLKPDDALVRTMLLALDWQRTSSDWTRDDGQFVPLPATWLNGHRWEDERPPESINGSRHHTPRTSTTHANMEALHNVLHELETEDCQ